MTGTLSPAVAASIAARVYDIKYADNFKLPLHSGFIKNFKLTHSQIKGISGGLINQLLNRSTGFALTAKGYSPQFQDHHVIAIRGTEFTSASDWLTNFHIGITNGPKNVGVHAGFQKTFRSMRPAFDRYVTEHRPKCIHCVGHSLGGALAQLTAIWASERSIPAKLYTFGAPRVVLSHFSPKAALNVEHHRMVHGADPVPYVPTWPFAHTAGEYQLAMSDSARLNASAHLMENDAPGYINTAGEHQDFNSMAGTFQIMNDESVVLHYENRHQASFSQRWQRRITNALITLLKVTGQYTAILGQASLSVGLTFYDVLARCLNGIAQASIQVGEQLKGILGHILVFVGKAEQKVEALTIKFIRWVLELMINTLYKTAKNAIDKVF